MKRRVIFSVLPVIAATFAASIGASAFAAGNPEFPGMPDLSSQTKIHDTCLVRFNAPKDIEGTKIAIVRMTLLGKGYLDANGDYVKSGQTGWDLTKYYELTFHAQEVISGAGTSKVKYHVGGTFKASAAGSGTGKEKIYNDVDAAKVSSDSMNEVYGDFMMAFAETLPNCKTKYAVEIEADREEARSFSAVPDYSKEVVYHPTCQLNASGADLTTEMAKALTRKGYRKYYKAEKEFLVLDVPAFAPIEGKPAGTYLASVRLSHSKASTPEHEYFAYKGAMQSTGTSQEAHDEFVTALIKRMPPCQYSGPLDPDND